MAETTEVQDDGKAIGLTPGQFAGARAAIDAGDSAILATLTAGLHPADIADLLEQLGPRERRALAALAPGLIDGEVLSELAEGLRDEVVALLAPGELALAVRELDSDDVVDLVETLEENAQESVLAALGAPERAQVERALAYPEYSAGRLMQVEVVRAPEHWTVAEATAWLRNAADLPDQFYHVILVDPRMKPVAYCTLGRILSASGATRLRDITEDSFRLFHVEDAEEDVARAFNRYHLISAPVVDDEDRLVGVITIDDAVRVLDDEHEEDLLRLAGVGDESSVADGAIATARQRLPWLVVNLFTASLSALIISRFEATISALVILAALMPIVASTGGIGGTQSLAVAVRALATRDLTSANAGRVIRRELGAGLMNGVGLALILGLGGWLIFSDPLLGGVLGMAMICNQTVAALGGVLVPLTMNRLGMDPALASGTFVTTLTDMMGFFAFLGLASLILL